VLEKNGDLLDRSCKEVKKYYIESRRNTIKKKKANWIGHILRRNCRLKYVIGGKIAGRIEMTG
jgi:hypothetical protein